MNLYFNGIWGTLSTLFLIGTIAYIMITILKRHQIDKWGKKIMTLLVIGLLLCIWVVMRDDYVIAVQGGQGLFLIDSLPIHLCYMTASVIGVGVILSLFIIKQSYREVMFYSLSIIISKEMSK